MLNVKPEASGYVYDPTWFRDIARVLKNSAGREREVRKYYGAKAWEYHSEWHPHGARQWPAREQAAAEFHSAVTAALHLSPCRNMVQLVMEWPHRSEDGLRLAYTPDERKGEKDIQTVTTPGRYIKRHFPLLSDEVIQRIVYQHNATGCSIHTDMETMLRAVNDGPTSCMQWDEDDIAEVGHHPYEAYDPEYGWGICIRMSAGQIVGRALVLNHGRHKCFVRTYKRSDSGYSPADEEMEGYLTAQGYKHVGQWPEGAKLKRLPNKNRRYDFVAPYIDGDCKTVESSDCLYIDSNGEYSCEYTNGGYEMAERYSCDECGDSFRDTDDLCGVGRYSQGYVCSHCIRNHFTHVVGCRGEDYYVRDDDAVTVDGQSYDREYLSHNDIVELHDGEYCHLDNAVRCEMTEEYYECDDCEYCEDKQGYVNRDDAWQCHATDKWYSDDEDSVEVDGETYHPDNAPEEETEGE